MEDAALSKEAALSLISGGADFVYGKLNAAQMGLIQAAKEKGVYTSGRSFGHIAAAPETVVTATIENWPSMYVAAAKAIKDGSIKPELMMYGFELAFRLRRGPEILREQGLWCRSSGRGRG